MLAPRASDGGKICRVLLHACCGPCSLMPVLRLREEGFMVTLFFYNPNIHPQEEYDLRREALEKAACTLDIPVLWEDSVPGLPEDGRTVHPAEWTARLGQATAEGVRCPSCYADRLGPTAELAKKLDFDAFCTSLLYSRYQHHEAIVREAERAASQASASFLYRDFRPWWQEGIDLSKDMGLYRQKWCGCILSRGEAERQRAELKERRKAAKALKREQNINRLPS